MAPHPSHFSFAVLCMRFPLENFYVELKSLLRILNTGFQQLNPSDIIYISGLKKPSNRLIEVGD